MVLRKRGSNSLNLLQKGGGPLGGGGGDSNPGGNYDSCIYALYVLHICIYINFMHVYIYPYDFFQWHTFVCLLDKNGWFCWRVTLPFSPSVKKLRFLWKGFSCFIELGHLTSKSPLLQQEQSTFESGKGPINGFSSIRTNPLSDTLKFLCNLLFSLINFWIACGSTDFPYFVSSLSNGFKYNNDLNRLFGFSPGILVSVFILEYILWKSEAVILPQCWFNQSFEDACSTV